MNLNIACFCAAGLLVVTGCAAGQSVWTKPTYQPPPPSFRGSRTYQPKATVSPYENHIPSIESFSGGDMGGEGSFGGSSSR